MISHRSQLSAGDSARSLATARTSAARRVPRGSGRWASLLRMLLRKSACRSPPTSRRAWSMTASPSAGRAVQRRSDTTRSNARTGRPCRTVRSVVSARPLWTTTPGLDRSCCSYGTARCTGVKSAAVQPCRCAAVAPVTTASAPPRSVAAATIVSGAPARAGSTSTPAHGEAISPTASALRTRRSPNAVTACFRLHTPWTSRIEVIIRRRSSMFDVGDRPNATLWMAEPGCGQLAHRIPRLAHGKPRLARRIPRLAHGKSPTTRGRRAGGAGSGGEGRQGGVDQHPDAEREGALVDVEGGLVDVAHRADS